MIDNWAMYAMMSADAYNILDSSTSVIEGDREAQGLQRCEEE
jgi:hypothetical protein